MAKTAQAQQSTLSMAQALAGALRKEAKDLNSAKRAQDKEIAGLQRQITKLTAALEKAQGKAAVAPKTPRTPKADKVDEKPAKTPRTPKADAKVSGKAPKGGKKGSDDFLL